MGETLEHLEANVEEYGLEASGFDVPGRMVREYKPDRMGVTSNGHPKPNETVMHYNCGLDRPFCHLRWRSTKWQMTGRKKKVTCKRCLHYMRRN